MAAQPKLEDELGWQFQNELDKQFRKTYKWRHEALSTPAKIKDSVRFCVRDRTKRLRSWRSRFHFDPTLFQENSH